MRRIYKEAVLASGDVFKVTLELALDAVQCRPGFYLVEGGGGVGPNPVQNCADAVAAALGPNPLTGFVQNLTLNGVRVEDVQPATAASLSTPVGPSGGTIADDNPPPPQDSMLLHLSTGVRRSVGVFAAIGRMYMPGIYSTGQISGFLIPDLFTALGVFSELLAGPFVDDGTAYQMHVVSFNPGTNPRTIRAIQPVVAITPTNQVAIQRRRRPGRGI